MHKMQVSAASAIWLIKRAGVFIVSFGSATTFATVVNTASFFLENQFSAVPTLITTGFGLRIEGSISDPLGVPGNIASVFARHTGTGQTITLNYGGLGNPATPTSAPYYRAGFFDQFPVNSRTGSWQIFAINDQGTFVTNTTANLRVSNPLVRAQNVQTSGDILAPAINWSRVPGADSYQLRVWDPTSKVLLYNSPLSQNPSFSISAGVLDPNRTYAIGVLSMDRDNAGNLIRRSFDVRSYSTETRPTIPIPIDPNRQLDTLDFAQFAKSAYRDSNGVALVNSYVLEKSTQTGNVDIRAWVNETKSKIVIGIGGTEQKEDLLRADSSWLKKEPDQNFVDHVKAGASLISDLRAKYPDAQIQLTGHSLGGAVAQVLSVGTGFKTVTFNAPGAGQFLDDPRIKEVIQSFGPSGGSSVENHRVYGDLVSTAGLQLGTVTTYMPPAARSRIDQNPLAYAVPMHLMDTVIEGLRSAQVASSLEYGPTVASTFSSTSIWAVKHAVPGAPPNEIALAVSPFSFVWADPGGPDGYLFKVANGSPLVRSVIFPFLLSTEAVFDLQLLIAGQWISQGLFQETDAFDFGPQGVDTFRFLVKDYDSLNPIFDVEDFSYGLSFVQDGIARVQIAAFSSVPEPGTLSTLIMACLGLCFLSKRRRLMHGHCRVADYVNPQVPGSSPGRGAKTSC